MMLSCNPVQNEDRHRSTGSTKDKRSTKKQKRQRRGAGIQVKKVEEEEETHGRKEKWIMPGVMEEDEEEEQSTDACSSSTTGNGKDAQSSRVNYWSDAEVHFVCAHARVCMHACVCGAVLLMMIGSVVLSCKCLFHYWFGIACLGLVHNMSQTFALVMHVASCRIK